MKVLIFNDTHLTNLFNKGLFDYIVNLIKDADQVIINGDFWDAYLTTFDEFIKSEWKKLFPLLKKKNTIYIFGNHDKEHFMDDRYAKFSNVQLKNYEFVSGNKVFYLTHGDVASPAYDQLRVFSDPKFVRPYFKVIWKILNSQLLCKFYEKLKLRFDLDRLKKIEEYALSFTNAGKYFIVGHSHLPKLNLQKKFISIGRLQNQNKNYCFIENGRVEFYSNEELR